jgi:hypothetical protein
VSTPIRKHLDSWPLCINFLMFLNQMLRGNHHRLDEGNEFIGVIMKAKNRIPGIVLGRLDINITSGLAQVAALRINGLDFIERHLKFIDEKRSRERERERERECVRKRERERERERERYAR